MGLESNGGTGGYVAREIVIRVEQIPGRKGVFLKHVEYDVIAPSSTVNRRYSDFAVLHDLLLQLFPTRIIPRLPPKKALGANDDFLASRQKALERYCGILGKHPVVGKSGVFQHFLTYTGKDLQGSLKSHFKQEEFDVTPVHDYGHIRLFECAGQLAQIKDHMGNAESSLGRIQGIFETINLATREQVKNHMALNSELSNLCSSGTSPFVEIVNGVPTVRQPFTGVLADVASEIGGVTTQWLDLANTEDTLFSDHLSMLKDLMKGWKDFFARQSKLGSDEQKILERANAAQKKPDGQTIEEVGQRSSATSTAESRLKFNVFCLQQELSFVESLLGPLMSKFVQTLASTEKRHFAKISLAWQDVEDVARLLTDHSTSLPPNPSSPSPLIPTSPTRSDVAGF